MRAQSGNIDHCASSTSLQITLLPSPKVEHHMALFNLMILNMALLHPSPIPPPFANSEPPIPNPANSVRHAGGGDSRGRCCSYGEGAVQAAELSLLGLLYNTDRNESHT